MNLYHVNSHKGISKKWEIGDIIDTCGYNNYLNNIISCCLYVENKPHPDIAISHVLRLVSDDEKVKRAKKISLEQRDRCLGNLRREYIFEKVRRENYPHLPSRLMCTYLSKSIDEAKLWANTINKQDIPFSILEVSAFPETKLFSTYSGHIDNLEYVIKDDEIIDKSNRYWRGECFGKPETLASGPLLVIGKIQQ